MGSFRNERFAIRPASRLKFTYFHDSHVTLDALLGARGGRAFPCGVILRANGDADQQDSFILIYSKFKFIVTLNTVAFYYLIKSAGATSYPLFIARNAESRNRTLYVR